MRVATCEEKRKETNAVLIPPYNFGPVISGQGTIGLEILEQVAYTWIGYLFIPSGKEITSLELCCCKVSELMIVKAQLMCKRFTQMIAPLCLCRFMMAQMPLLCLYQAEGSCLEC